MRIGFNMINKHHTLPVVHTTWFPIVGGSMGGIPPNYDFFLKLPHQNRCSPHGAHPPLKNEAPPYPKDKSPLRREVPFHEMIPRKSTINNNLKSS